MTVAFNKFMRQYQMTGSEKADGYSRDAFDGLAPDEADEVFHLLLNELPWSAEWLFYVNPERATAVAKAREPAMRTDPYQHTYLLQLQLINYSGDLEYQRHMIEDYPNYIKRIKPQVVDAIAATPSNRAAIDFFKQVILVDAQPGAVARASMHLLFALHMARDTEQDKVLFDRLTLELRNDDSAIKQRAFARLAQYDMAA